MYVFDSEETGKRLKRNDFSRRRQNDRHRLRVDGVGSFVREPKARVGSLLASSLAPARRATASFHERAKKRLALNETRTEIWTGEKEY
jgi:hypothetical protein